MSGLSSILRAIDRAEKQAWRERQRAIRDAERQERAAERETRRREREAAKQNREDRRLQLRIEKGALLKLKNLEQSSFAERCRRRGLARDRIVNATLR